MFDGYTEEERAAEMVRIFGRDVPAQDIVGWTGLLQLDVGPNTVIDVSVAGRSVSVLVSTPRYELRRSYGRRIMSGELAARHDSFVVAREWRRKGISTAVTVRAVRSLRAAGFKSIDLHAAGSADDPQFKGYKVWPRMGFDGRIPELVRPRLPQNLAGVQTLLELMSSKEGRDWWDERGRAYDGEFDLAPDSASSRALEEYAASKRRKRRDGEAGAEVEDIDLDEDELAALDEVWDRIEREGWPEGTKPNRLSDPGDTLG